MYKPSGLEVFGQVIEVFVSLLFHVIVCTLNKIETEIRAEGQ